MTLQVMSTILRLSCLIPENADRVSWLLIFSTTLAIDLMHESRECAIWRGAAHNSPCVLLRYVQEQFSVVRFGLLAR